MAKIKKNAIGNIIFPMVDSTDFASIESGITASDFNSAATKKFYGVNHGVSNVYTSGALSHPTLLVRSGIFHQELKTAETNYDHVMYRFIHASCADQLLVFETATHDDSDMYSYMSDLNSNIISMVSDLVSQVSDVQSQIDSGVSAFLSASNLSDIASAVWADAIGAGIVSDVSVLLSNVSDIESQIDSGVNISASGVSDIGSRVKVVIETAIIPLGASNISDIGSRVWSEKYTAHSAASSFGSLMSDILSSIGDVSVSLTASDISDIASAIVAAGVSIDASTMSDIASRVWAEPAAVAVISDVSVLLSNVSDVESQLNVNASLLDDITGQASVLLSNLSDVDSQLIVNFSLLSDVDSQVLLNASMISDVQSQIDSGVVVGASSISDIGSRVWADVIGASLVSRVLVIQSNLSDVESQIDSGVKVGVSSISDIGSRVWSEKYTAHSAASSFGSLMSDIYSLISDVDSQITLNTATLSTLASSVSDVDSQLTVNYSLLSDVDSQLTVHTSTLSDIYSLVSDVDSQVVLGATSNYLSQVHSDLASAIGNVSVTLTASDISDIASAIAAEGVVTDSNMSDIASRVWATTVRTLTQGAASVTAAVVGSTVTVYRGSTWVIALTGLGSLTDYDTIYFSVKEHVADSDNDAVLRVKDDASGLLRWNKAAVATATNGVITIDDAAAGDITITVLEAETQNAAVRGGYSYDVKGVDDDGQVDLLSLGDGAFEVAGDVTRAITS